MTTFQPILNSLPQAQRQFWPELRRVPTHFVLYGGTAIALRLTHRQSIDFAFFAAVPFDPERLQRDLAWGPRAEVLQKSENTFKPQSWDARSSHVILRRTDLWPG